MDLINPRPRIHVVTLNVDGQTVSADVNPLGGLQPGDRVRFDVTGEVAGREFAVKFLQARWRCALEGPFTGALQGLTMTGTVAEGQRDRFLYRVFARPEGVLSRWSKLQWGPEHPGPRFGGIDVPQPPPE